MRYGLKKETIEKIISIFERYEKVEAVVLFGSRAMGNYKSGSDIDLTIKGDDLNLKLLNKISSELDDLFLPYTFDLSIYNQIKNQALLDHIKRVGRVFYSQGKVI